jgi:DNA-binding Lrp family transcriptional regulator
VPTKHRPDRLQRGCGWLGSATFGRWCELVSAYVLIQTEVGTAGQVASAAAEINGVHEAQPLTGPYDVIVRAEASSIDALGKLVVSRIQAINGVTRTLTCPVVHL